MACKQLENIWELTPMRFFTAARQRFWNIWNKIIVPSTSFTPEGTSVFLGWAKKMLSIPTPASGHSFFVWQLLLWRRKSTSEVKFVIFLTNDHHKWKVGSCWERANKKHCRGNSLQHVTMSHTCPIPKWRVLLEGRLLARWHTYEQGWKLHQSSRDHWTWSSCSRHRVRVIFREIQIWQP